MLEGLLRKPIVAPHPTERTADSPSFQSAPTVYDTPKMPTSPQREWTDIRWPIKIMGQIAWRDYGGGWHEVGPGEAVAIQPEGDGFAVYLVPTDEAVAGRKAAQAELEERQRLTNLRGEIAEEERIATEIEVAKAKESEMHRARAKELKRLLPTEVVQ